MAIDFQNTVMYQVLSCCNLSKGVVENLDCISVNQHYRYSPLCFGLYQVPPFYRHCEHYKNSKHQCA